ncbi:MAG: hypothetical protein LBQ90_00685 [Synergistaceae bacterium]|nr:hypothetical protein [Synergistaceae bacterium]
MGTIGQDIRDYFSRHFLGRVRVKNLGCVVAAPQVFSSKRVIATCPVRTKMQVVGSTLFTFSGVACSNRGFRFAAQFVKARGSKIARYAPGEIGTHTVSWLKTTARSDKKRVEVLPQERSSRLQWQRVRPRKEGEVILAWFGPLIEEAIVKSTLNKQQGTLLIWYNPQSRHFNASGLYLYRHMGRNENLEWRWS